jgi:hypothetical protein
MGLPIHGDLKSFIVIVAAGFAFGHCESRNCARYVC